MPRVSISLANYVIIILMLIPTVWLKVSFASTSETNVSGVDLRWICSRTQLDMSTLNTGECQEMIIISFRRDKCSKNSCLSYSLQTVNYVKDFSWWQLHFLCYCKCNKATRITNQEESFIFNQPKGWTDNVCGWGGQGTTIYSMKMCYITIYIIIGLWSDLYHILVIAPRLNTEQCQLRELLVWGQSRGADL